MKTVLSTQVALRSKFTIDIKFVALRDFGFLSNSTNLLK
jgi:hypothetical protein